MKKRFMPQHYFDMCAVTVAQIAVHTGKSEYEVSEEMLSSLDQTYDDILDADEVTIAAKKIREIVREFLPGEERASNFTQIQYCVKHYEIDGKKKRRRILGGSRFVYEKTEIPDKANNSIRNVACFTMLSTSGKIPIAPSDWSF